MNTGPLVHPPSRWRQVLPLALAVALAALCGLLVGAAPAQPVKPAQNAAVVLAVDGAIGPASADYIRRGLERAAQEGAAAVVLRIDTPGGLDTSMREIIRSVLASPVPVLTFVAPNGARAASAGTYILYASHVAAMAPGTNLGAATPVQLGGGGSSPLPGPAAPASAPASGPQPASRNPSEAKALNDAVAYIRSLAQLRGRNADWAEQAVREAASLPAREALARQVIDLVADDIPSLLRAAHGRTVRMDAGVPGTGGGTLKLQTDGLELRPIDADWRTRVMGVLTNPNVALILMMVGIYGLLFEFMSPGALVPGVVGAISLLLGLYALSVLPLDYTGVALMLLGVALLVAEAFAPSFGILGIGGVLAFLMGASMLVDTEAPGFELSLPLVGGLAVAALLTSVLVLRLALRARRPLSVSGTAMLPGQTARVLDWAGDSGHVMLAGERWRAGGASGLQPGQTVRVQAVEGLFVRVQPAPLADRFTTSPPPTRHPGAPR